MKHTKGPWTVSDDGDTFFIHYEKKNQTVGTVWTEADSHSESTDEDKAEALANAHLMAAAPEMFQMLCSISIHLLELGESELWDKTTILIKKALGK